MGMKIWYGINPEQNIKEIFSDFSRIFLENGPAYIQGLNNDHITDLCYSLIGFYSNSKQYSLEKVIDAKGYTIDNLEKRLLWLLCMTLRVMIGQGNKGTYIDSEEIRNFYRDNKEMLCSLSLKAIEEFEMLGYWHWAILVWLLSKDLFNSEHIIKGIENLLLRNSKELAMEECKEKFLIEKLKIPDKMIKKAKGIYYMTVQDWPNAIQCLSDADEWNLTHELLWENIVPSFIISKGLPASVKIMIKMLLNKLALHSSQITDWQQRGQILFKFLNIYDKLKNKSVVFVILSLNFLE